MNIKVKTRYALNLLDENRQAHIDEFAAQMQGWKKAMVEFGTELATWRDNASEDILDVESEKKNKRPIEPQRPMSFVKDYDRLIELLENHEEDLVDIEEYEFNQIIKNEFNWRQGFLAMSNTYSSK